MLSNIALVIYFSLRVFIKKTFSYFFSCIEAVTDGHIFIPGHMEILKWFGLELTWFLYLDTYLVRKWRMRSRTKL